MTVLDFITLTRRGWKMLVVAVLLGLVVAGAYVLVAPRVYEASSNGFLSVSGANVVAGSDQATAQAASYLPLISSKPVYDRIAKAEGVDPSTLRGNLSAGLVSGTTMIQVTATSGSPQTAVRLANGALSALAEVITEIQSQGGNAQGATLKVIPLANATIPTAPVSPKWEPILALGAGAGLLLGYLLIFLRRALDVKVRTNTDMGELLGAGVLGRVPRLGGRRGRVSGSEIESLSGESFRQIRTGLRFASVDGEVRSVVVTSANQSEGKSSTAIRLATVLAETGQRTLIIDGDLRRPTIAGRFGMDGNVGLSEVLSGQIGAAEAIRATTHENLFVLPAGGIPPNPSEMLGAQALAALVGDLAKECFVILDTPPVLPVTDALLAATAVDGVIFVTAVGQTRKTDVTAARKLLHSAHVRLLGVVLNKVPLGDSDGGYSHYRQNRSYYTRPAPTGIPSGKARKGASAQPVAVQPVAVQPAAVPQFDDLLQPAEAPQPAATAQPAATPQFDDLLQFAETPEFAAPSRRRSR